MNRVWKDRLVYWAVWLACAAPIGWIVYLGLNDGLTANPIEKVIRTIGDDGLYILISSLGVTPAARILRQPRLIRFRRTIGLWGFAYVSLHLLTYVCIDQFFDWGAIGKDILKRPFITVGMAAFVLLIPLAVTSTNGMMRRMGPRAWRRLHKLVYLIVPLGVVHYFLMVKLDTRPVVLFGMAVALMLAWRLVNWALPPKPARRKAAVPKPAPGKAGA
jgi:sulfoxide reductase heme-binding subunit YedZ